MGGVERSGECRWCIQMTGNGKGERPGGMSVTGTNQGRRSTEGEFVGDITGVWVVRVFVGAFGLENDTCGR